jgi:adenosine deaminase
MSPAAPTSLPVPGNIPVEFLRAVPKTDLHVHLDGSVRLSTLIELAQQGGMELPSYTCEGMYELVFRERYANLGEYLRGFDYITQVLQTAAGLERCAYELAEDNQKEGVLYLEVRFAPQKHVHPRLDTVAVLRAVDQGLARARDDFNRHPDVQQGRRPPFEYGIICTAMRMFCEGISNYYTTLLRAHRFAPPKQVFGLASLELARAAVIARDQYGLQIVGLDLAGEEAGYPADDHIEAYRFAHKNFLRKTVHAGEAYGPESIFQAITDLYAERIGHGTYLLDPGAITDPSIVNRQEYVERIGQFIADRRITLEVCLSSNLQTNPHIKDLSQHSFSKLRAARLSTTICTDNRLVSRTTVTRELQLATQALSMDLRQVRSIIVYGFKRSFYPHSYLRKRQYVRQVIDYYESIERQFFGGAAPAP